METKTVTPKRKQALRDSTGRFLPGNRLGWQKGESGNPTGAGKAQKIRDQIFSTFNLKKFKVWGEKHQSEYYQLLGKLMPRTLEHKGDMLGDTHITVIRTEAKKETVVVQTRRPSGRKISLNA